MRTSCTSLASDRRWAVPAFPRSRVPSWAALAILVASTATARAADAPDAVIELWEQHWTLGADGSTVYHEKQHVRLNDERAFGEFADPRLTYNEDTDKLDIIVAHVKRPDGTLVELPEYAHVQVSPDASAGWPAFAGIRQHLLVMSGIEPNCVVELEYKITTKPGARPFLAGDIRLDHRYPIQERKVTLSVPANVTLKTATTNLPASAHAATPNAIVLRDVPAVRDEPQSPPWQARCARLMFTTVGQAGDWAKRRYDALDRAADSSELTQKLAGEWTKEVQDPSGRLRALQEKLAATFNFVDLPVDWRPGTIRPASEVLRGNYGIADEAAAALLALARAAGLDVRPGILLNDDLWNAEAPQDSMVAAYVVVLIPKPDPGNHVVAMSIGDNPDIWDARRGRVVREARWSGCTLLPVPGVTMPRARLPKWTDADESRCIVTGKITLADDGNFAGTLTLRTTGFFTSSEGLRAADAQKGRVAALAARVLPDVSVESFAVKLLAPGEFEASAQVKSSKALKKLGDRFLLQLAQDGPFLADVPLPLAYHERELPVRVTGPFCEDVDLTIEWPEKWQLETRPRELPEIRGEWGALSQTLTVEAKSLKLQRATRLARAELPASDFLRLREPLNELRTEAARTVTLVKP